MVIEKLAGVNIPVEVEVPRTEYDASLPHTNTQLADLHEMRVAYGDLTNKNAEEAIIAWNNALNTSEVQSSR